MEKAVNALEAREQAVARAIHEAVNKNHALAGVLLEKYAVRDALNACVLVTQPQAAATVLGETKRMWLEMCAAASLFVALPAGCLTAIQYDSDAPGLLALLISLNSIVSLMGWLSLTLHSLRPTFLAFQDKHLRDYARLCFVLSIICLAFVVLVLVVSYPGDSYRPMPRAWFTFLVTAGVLLSAICFYLSVTASTRRRRLMTIYRARVANACLLCSPLAAPSSLSISIR